MKIDIRIKKVGNIKIEVIASLPLAITVMIIYLLTNYWLVVDGLFLNISKIKQFLCILISIKRNGNQYRNLCAGNAKSTKSQGNDMKIFLKLEIYTQNGKNFVKGCISAACFFLHL